MHNKKKHNTKLLTRRLLSFALASTMVLSNLSSSVIAFDGIPDSPSEVLEEKIDDPTEVATDPVDLAVEETVVKAESEYEPDYMVILQKVIEASYTYDPSRVLDLDPDFITLVYEEGENVKIGISSDYAFHFANAATLSNCGWTADADGNTSFKMPAYDVALILDEKKSAPENDPVSEYEFITENTGDEETEAMAETETEAITEAAENTEVSEDVTEASVIPDESEQFTEASDLLEDSEFITGAEGAFEETESAEVTTETSEAIEETEITTEAAETPEENTTETVETTDETEAITETIITEDVIITEPAEIMEETEAVSESAETEEATEAVTEAVGTTEETAAPDSFSETEMVTEVNPSSEEAGETELNTEGSEETEYETEAVEVTEIGQETDTTPVIDESYETVSDEEMYYLTLPASGETEVLKTRHVWTGDTAFDFTNYVPETATTEKAVVTQKKNNVNINKCGSYEIIYNAVLTTDAGYSWDIVVPIEIVADKYEADTFTDEFASLLYLFNYGDSSKTGTIPKHIGDTVRGKDLVVYAGEDFNLLEADFDYDWNVFALELIDDGGFDTNECGIYHAVFEVYAFEDLAQKFYLTSTITVEEKEEVAGETAIHVTSGEITATVTVKGGKKYEATYGNDAVVNKQIKSITLTSTYGNEIDPEISILVNGQPDNSASLYTLTKEEENTYKLTVNNTDTDAAYEIVIGSTYIDMNGKLDKRTPGWEEDDEGNVIYRAQEDDTSLHTSIGTLLSSNPFVIHAEAADTVSKSWSGKSTVVKSLQTYGSDSGYSEVGAKTKAHVYIKDAVKSELKEWITETLGLDLEGSIPSSFDVKCCKSGAWGWYTSNALSQCCSNVKLTATVQTNSKGEVYRIKLYLKCYAKSGFQDFSATKYIPVSETPDGYLKLVKKSASDNFIKLCADMSIDTTFMVYSDSACEDEVADIDIDSLKTTDTSVTETVTLEEGKYWVVETSRLKGHVWNTKKYPITVTAGETTSLTVENQPWYFNDVFLTKFDQKTKKPLANAIFKVEAFRSNASIGVWYFKTDSDGEIAYDKAHLVSTWNGKTSNALITVNSTVGVGLPYNTTLKCTEVEAPAGYILDPTERSLSVSQSRDGTAYKVQELTCDPLVVDNKPDEGYVTLIKKSANDDVTLDSTIYSLAGAVYKVYDSTKKEVGTLTTKADGSTNSLLISSGTYTVKEVKAPANFKLDEKTYTVKVTAANTSSNPAVVTSVEEPLKGSFKIQKQMEKDQLGPDEYSAKPGATIPFKIISKNHKDSKGRWLTYEGTTDKDGNLTFGNLLFGTWKVEELPSDNNKYYELSKTEVIVDTDKVPVEWKNTNKLYKAFITVQKKDAVSGNVITRSNATFKFVNASGKDVTIYGKDSSGNPVPMTEFTTNSDGQFVLSSPIPGGVYKLVEINPPVNYAVWKDGVTFTVDETNNGKQYTVVMKDEPVKGNVSITKLDSVTDEPLEGFEFGVFAAEDILDGSGSVYKGYSIDSQVDTLQTNKDGAAVGSLVLYPGKYYVKETKTRKGYVLNPEKFPFEITQAVGADGKLLEATVNASVTVKDEKNGIKILKKSSTTGNALKGIEFRVKPVNDADNDSQLYVTDENGQIHVSDLEISTEYIIKETKTIPGYNLDPAAEAKFTVDADGKINGKAIEEFTFENKPNKLYISKYDITDSKELPGAELVITDNKGTEIEKWVSTDKPHYIEALPAGDYRLTETITPAGYEVTEVKEDNGAQKSYVDFKVIDSEIAQTVKMANSPYRDVLVSKKDITGSEELPGAELNIYDDTGKLVTTWKSGTDGQDEEGNYLPHKVTLASGVYTLSETIAPIGYATKTTDVKFTVEKRAAEGDVRIDSVLMKDEPIKVLISKKDITNEEEVIGATLYIEDMNGNKVDVTDGEKTFTSWISAKDPQYIEKLPVGTYRLVEELAPTNFEKNAIEFTITDSEEIQTVVMKDGPFRDVEISKIDATDSHELEGATLTITGRANGEDKDITPITWVSGCDGKDEKGNVIPHMVKLAGGKYTLTETIKTSTVDDKTIVTEGVPSGYISSSSVNFEVISTSADDFKVQHVTMKDERTKIQISKQDLTTKKELPGAVLQIYDSKGNTKDEWKWTSTNEPHYIEMLPQGVYTLKEITAPNGYEVAETVQFTIDNSAVVHKATMYDAKKPTGNPGGGPGTPAPQTGDDFPVNTAVGFGIVFLFLLTAAVLLLKKKKNK